MKSLTDKMATVAAFALGALGLFLAMQGFAESSAGWVIFGLMAFVGAVMLWVRINPTTPAKHAADKTDR
jgi:hypothetical protein